MDEVFDVVKRSTREVVTQVGLSFREVKSGLPYKKWMIINMNGLHIMRDCQRVDDFRSWVWLMENAGPNNMVSFTNRRIAADLGVSEQRICAALRRLRKSSVLITTSDSGGKIHQLGTGLHWNKMDKGSKNLNPIGRKETYDNEFREKESADETEAA